MRKVELLVPASSLEVLKIAVVFGADAVYIGGEAFGLRAKAKNFSHEDMAEGIAFAHSHGVKVYVTVNILAHNGDLPGVREYLQELKELKPDALIIDMASKPGGVDTQAAARLNRKVVRALALPGKTAPVTAGGIIKDTIYNMLHELGA